MERHRRLAVLALGLALSLAGCAGRGPGADRGEGEARLVGYARLPAASFVAGPASGARLGRGLLNGQAVPFAGQPVQGLSGLLREGEGLLALADNGFGTRQNSPDALLQLFRLEPGFRSAEGGSGRARVRGVLRLADPDRLVPFPLRRGATPERWLTGADFDPEALAPAAGGGWWIGEEFGPFLLRVDAAGRLREPPIALPDPEHPGQVLKSPDHPELRGRPAAGARVRRSGGIEGLSAFPDGRRLLIALEKPLKDEAGRVLLLEFDTEARRYTGRSWRYPLSPGAEGLGEILLLSDHTGLALEHGGPGRDGPRWLRRFELLPGGRLALRAVADFAALPDPSGLGPAWPGAAQGRMNFPFQSLEGLALWDANRIVVGNDNNYPYGTVRHRAKRHPDDSEFLLVNLPRLPGRP